MREIPSSTTTQNPVFRYGSLRLWRRKKWMDDLCRTNSEQIQQTNGQCSASLKRFRRKDRRSRRIVIVRRTYWFAISSCRNSPFRPWSSILLSLIRMSLSKSCRWRKPPIVWLRSDACRRLRLFLSRNIIGNDLPPLCSATCSVWTACKSVSRPSHAFDQQIMPSIEKYIKDGTTYNGQFGKNTYVERYSSRKYVFRFLRCGDGYLEDEMKIAFELSTLCIPLALVWDGRWTFFCGACCLIELFVVVSKICDFFKKKKYSWEWTILQTKIRSIISLIHPSRINVSHWIGGTVVCCMRWGFLL
jgi:hypothetical protein